MKESVIGELTVMIDGYEKVEVSNRGYITHTYPSKCFQLMKCRKDWEKLFINTKFSDIKPWHITKLMKYWNIKKIKPNSPMYQLRSIIKRATQEGMIAVNDFFELFPECNEIMVNVNGKKKVVCKDGYNRGGWQKVVDVAEDDYRFMTEEEKERKKWKRYVEQTYNECERLHKRVLAAYRGNTTSEQRQKLEAEYNAVKMRVYHIENPTHKGEKVNVVKVNKDIKI